MGTFRKMRGGVVAMSSAIVAACGLTLVGESSPAGDEEPDALAGDAPRTERG